MCECVQQNRILTGLCNVNIFCSNEANEFSVFCSKPPYLVGHSFFFYLLLLFNGSSDVTRKEARLCKR